MRLSHIGVMGAGTTGRSIIRTLAGSGLSVTFCELNNEMVKQVLNNISENLDREIARWGLTAGEKRLILSRIKGVSKMEDLSGVQMVIECIPGEMREKQTLYQKLDEFFPPQTILVANSATANISDLAKHVRHPERIAGMHFSYPAHQRAIAEIVRGRKTSDETIKGLHALAKTIKKTVIEVFEMPGQITTRVMVPFINEAIQIVMEGLATAEQVDLAMRLSMKIPTGPLALADQLGLDSLLFTMDRMFRALGDLKYRPCPLLRRMVREGRLGVKNGRGFFIYDKNGNIIEPAKAK